MNLKKWFLPAFLLHQLVFAQVIPADRRTDWSLAGYRDSIPVYTTIVDITAFGGVGDGVTSNNTALQNAIASLGGASGTIYFPTGNFRFNASFALRDSIILKGNSADSTMLSFNLSGNSDMIRIAGSISSSYATLAMDAVKDSSFLMVSNPSLFNAGDYIKISQNDSSLLASNWAYGSVGQIVQVNSIAGNRINLNSPLRKDFMVTDSCKLRKMTPKHDIGIECLKIKRLDVSAGQTNNIDINYGVKCWIKGVEMDTCNFAHIAVSNSSNIEISGCYLHDAFAFGGGGQAYGVLVQYCSGECLVENNIFNHLRHAMILQAGANGNVFGYNSSTNPYWVSGFLPTNSAGDMVLHGNYPFLNLFEGNTGQNIVIDNSHGINGPYNTFFRNRADLYGIFMNTSPASDNQNFVGNEVTSTATNQGLYFLSGTGQLAHGNNIKGTIMPAGTETLSDTSYYKKNVPGFFNSYSLYPPIGIPNTISTGTIPAQQKQMQAAEFTDCTTNYPFVFLNRHTAVNDTFCSGSTYSFNGNAIDTAGTYADTIAGSNYDSIITLHLAETMMDTAITISGSTLSSAETNAAYEWIDCSNDSLVAGATGPNFSPTQTGNYRVRITKDSCIAESGCASVTVSGLKEPEAFSFPIYPIPASQFVMLDNSAMQANILRIYSVEGKLMREVILLKGLNRMDIIALPSGLYFASVSTGERKTYSSKLLIENQAQYWFK